MISLMGRKQLQVIRLRMPRLTESTVKCNAVLGIRRLVSIELQS